MVKLGDMLKVTRDDIQDFPGDTIDLILELQKEGWRAQRSNRNHVMLLAPDGVTRYSASRNASSAKYLAEDIARYKKGDTFGSVDEEGVMKRPEQPSKKFPCPQKDCQKFYASQEKLNVHIAVDHSGWLKCPDCDETRADLRRLNIHRTRTHGYVSPRKAQRKQQEANRAARKVEGETPLTPEVVEELRGGPVDLEKSLGEAGKSTGREKPMDSISLENIIPDGSRISLKGVEVDLEKQTRIVKRVIDREMAHGGYTNKSEIDFIDERDSWTLNLEPIMDMRIVDVARVLHAAGLNLEMRSWKDIQ